MRTIDIAAVVNASQSTVSRALAGDARISKSTRERVIAAAEQLGYRPNMIARGLKNRTTGIVGVMVTDLDNWYHAHSLRVLVDRMGERGLAPLVFACSSSQSAASVISRLLSYQVDAVIALAAPHSREIVQICQSGRTPLVLMNRHDGPEDVSTVRGDGAAGGALVAEHLIAQGAASFGYFAGDDRTLISRERELGFSTRLTEAGIGSLRRTESVYDYDDARGAAAVLLDRHPDAVFCANDTLAFALADVARCDFGLRIPQDIMIAGYDNSAFAARTSYDLTSVDHDLEAIVDATVSEAVARIADPERQPSPFVVAPRLVTRKSTSREPQ